MSITKQQYLPTQGSWRMRSSFALLFSCLLLSQQLYAKPGSGYGPKPLDPLTQSEVDHAKAIASNDPSIKALAQGKVKLVAVDFAMVKPDGRRPITDEDYETMGRHAVVTFYDYKTHQSLATTVNLTDGKVEGIKKESGDSAPLSEEETQEAIQDVRNDADIQRLLRGTASEHEAAAFKVVATQPGDECYGQRCVEVFLHRKRQFRTDLPSIIVNLTKGQVYKHKRTNP